MMTGGKPKKIKKSKLRRIMSGQGTEQDYRDVYGESAQVKPSVSLSNECLQAAAAMSSTPTVSAKGLPELLSWLFGEKELFAHKPRWIDLQHRHVVHDVVYVHIQNCPREVNAAPRSRNLSLGASEICLQLRYGADARGDNDDVPRPLSELLYVQDADGTQKRRKRGRNETHRAGMNAIGDAGETGGIQKEGKSKTVLPLAWEELLATVDQVREYDYPSEVISEMEKEAIAENVPADSAPKGLVMSAAASANTESLVSKRKLSASAVDPGSPVVSKAPKLEKSEDFDMQQATTDVTTGLRDTSDLEKIVDEDVVADEPFVRTVLFGSSRRYDVLAVDCEMVKTSQGLELARVSVVDQNLKVVYDQFVKPHRKIIDYLTRYSGITSKILENVKLTLKEVQEDLLELIAADTVLVGHALENDLQALRLCHTRLIDTCILYPNRHGPPARSSLRYLCKAFLNRGIQNGHAGHDSVEDAIATMQLAQLKKKNGLDFGVSATSKSRSLVSTMGRCNVAVSVLGRHANGTASAIVCKSDSAALRSLTKLLGKKGVNGTPDELSGQREDLRSSSEENRQRRFILLLLDWNSFRTPEDETRWSADVSTSSATNVGLKSAMNDTDAGAKDDHDIPKGNSKALERVNEALSRIVEALHTNSLLITSTEQSMDACRRLLRQRTGCLNPRSCVPWSSQLRTELQKELDSVRAGTLHVFLKY